MPELPEVETVMRGLKPVLEGVTIRKAQAFAPKLRVPIDENFGERLSGNQIERLERRSKYILITFADGLVAIMHLGMSGRMTIFKNGSDIPERGKHDHILIETERGDLVIYNDPRRFGMWVLTDTEAVNDHALIKDIGPEPLGNAFHEGVLKAGLSKRKSPIKTALLDQKLVAGLGNIYVCEALWRTGIHPARLSNTITDSEIEALVPTIRDVLTSAIEAGGSTLKDYAQVDGELGYFQHSFKAYGREGEACLKQECGGVIDRIVQSNRSSFYCNCCQT
ncbi:bifunctional DNA-formamidopyrimidine glycosylase/DNA-(apurinic or apyrimidinic site) lyase [Kordiimonas sp. SCSIO 12610]|uniref:bifunctional DNA-formamidopyrimidine glycosylase/DNA-(apurinic or apyrimidinic site) lyase n=1 Tax=Kordiimonas sp. SCSIO 12610 TaxID=2829597 RepID=UPI002109845E|nr:bifunctional DNA-formamidopyrimidine glycosylase/DNA-(apurinic or apyrimidinic site) lyase [Kordiimonas sp. SCSIO 12610]UTW55327.1 bifunctional DNA-formamidopyrimidine glycosylase/DNA-(apurinic or apyrimidinic site) lyase [Kordiimonas sp. SCSIO 12610]